MRWIFLSLNNFKLLRLVLKIGHIFDLIRYNEKNKNRALNKICINMVQLVILFIKLLEQHIIRTIC